MAGLLDYLSGPSTGDGIGGLLSYLQAPFFQAPKQDDNKALSDALRGSPYEGGLPQLNPQSIWSQPGINYGPGPAAAPASPFDSGTAGIANLGGWSPGVQQPQSAPQPPPLSTVQSAPSPAQAPQNPIDVGGYQVPRIGDPSLFQPSPAAQVAQSSPASALSANAQQPPQQQSSPTFLGGAASGIGDRLNAGFQNFTNAGGPLQALAGGLTGLFTGNRTDTLGIQQQNQAAQFHAIRGALEANGDTPQQAASKAMVAVLNPEAAKTILPELFTSKEKYGVISDNPIEGKKYGFVNERDQTINGKPIGAGGGDAQATFTMLAPGVKQYNPNLSGEDYLNQFSPEVKAATKAWLNGDVLPSGNPRQNGVANIAKTIGQKYAADLGIPASDALYAEKRKYRTELGSNSANSAGGQAKAFNQGISHLTDLADKLEKLDNSNGFGIPILAQGANAARQGFSTQQSAIADEAKSLGQTVAGEVGKLFSGSAGGGVHERELTRERFDTVKSKPQLAAALRATIETMNGGLQALEQRRDAILGPNSDVQFVSDQTKQNIAKIQGVIDRLEGKSTTALPSGWSVKVR